MLRKLKNAIVQFLHKPLTPKQDKPQPKIVTISFIDGKMILGCDRCFEVHPEDPYIKAWLGASDRGRFEAEVTSNSVKFRKKLAAV
jgi:hypothetical protein